MNFDDSRIPEDAKGQCPTCGLDNFVQAGNHYTCPDCGCEFDNKKVLRQGVVLGDRTCPECEKITLIEHGLDKWKCLLCGKIWDEDWLDESED